VDVHHLRLRSEGGGHESSNIAVLCGQHHSLCHRGWLSIEGDAEGDLTFSHADGTVYGGPADPAAVEAGQAAFAGLRDLGLREGDARARIARARSHMGPDATEGALIEHALRHGAVAPAGCASGVDADVIAGLTSLDSSRARARQLLADARAELGAGAEAGALVEQALRSSRGPGGASCAREEVWRGYGAQPLAPLGRGGRPAHPRSGPRRVGRRRTPPGWEPTCRTKRVDVTRAREDGGIDIERPCAV
jgi:hypothetical protein